MATRTEKVVLELDDQFTSGMARAAASAALLRRELDGINGSQFGNFNRQTTTATTSVNNFGRSMDQNGVAIDRFSGRLGIAVDAVLALGPGLIPIGAVAGQAAAGLAALGAAAVVAAGSAVVAFQGIGDAIEAIQEYQDDPTADNLKAAREELDKMAPAARQFVMAFQRVRPMFSDLQDAAARGWFPGLTQALRDLDQVAPKLEEILFKSGQMGGTLTANIVESLSGPRWDDFLSFVADEVPSAMASLTRTMGSLAHGAAEMWMSFDPGNDSFMAWVEGVAAGFDRWASSADGRDDISAFLQYAKETGPDVAELFSSLVGALAAITRAAAPLGGPVLDGLTAFADIVKVIADSDMATPILAGIAALRVYNRVAAVATATTTRLTAATRANAAATPISAAAAGMVPPHLTGVANQPRPGATPSRAASYMPLLGGAAGAAVLVVAAGAAMKAAEANNALVESLDTLQSAIDALDFAAMTTGLDAAESEMADFQEKLRAGGEAFAGLTDPGAYLANQKNMIEGIFGDSDSEELNKRLNSLRDQAETAKTAVASLGEAMGMSVGPTDGSARSIAELESVLDAARPAMDALGISQKELTEAQGQQNLIAEGGMWGAYAEAVAGTKAPFDDLTASIREQAELMDSAQGRADNYRAVLRGLASDAGTAAEQADRFREAMEALTAPTLDAEAALSAQRDVLKEIKELNADAGFTQKTEVGRANLEATRDYTAAVQERIATMIAADRSERDIARSVKTSREQFIQAGIAAGFSAEQMRKRADVIGLTPKLVETTFRALGITKLEQDTRALRRQYDDLPKDVRTYIRLNGVPESIGEANRLARQLDLTAKERKALMRLVTDGKENMAAAKSLLDSFRDKSVTLSVNTVRTTTIRTFRSGSQAVDSADGGSVPKDGGPYTDRFPYMLAPGEEVITNRNGEADRFRAARAAGKLPGLANGGTASAQPFNSGTRDVYTPGLGGLTHDVFIPGAAGIANAANGLSAAMIKLTRLSDKELKQRERTLTQAIKLQEKELRRDEKAADRERRETDILKQRVDMLRQERDAIRDSIAARFETNPFADQNLAEGEKPKSIENILGGDIRDAAEMLRLVAALSAKGLDGDALTYLLQNASKDQLRTYAAGSAYDVQNFENLFNQRANLAGMAGMSAANAEGVGPQLAAAQVVYQAQLVVQRAVVAEAQETNRQLRDLNQRQARLERAQELNDRRKKNDDDKRADKQSRDVVSGITNGINGAVVKGSRGRA